jgi:c-di-GMP-binding flagellar brake protein YcgR
LFADQYIAMIDRRFDLRVPVAETVFLAWTDQTGQAQQGPAHLADISASGASVRFERPVKLGTTVSLDYQDQTFAGKVKNCVASESAYLLGIEFEAGYRWSPRRVN